MRLEEVIENKIENCNHDCCMNPTKLSEEICGIIKDAGYIHKSEIRFPDKKTVPVGLSSYNKEDLQYDGYVKGVNDIITETKKLNGVE